MRTRAFGFAATVTGLLLACAGGARPPASVPAPLADADAAAVPTAAPPAPSAAEPDASIAIAADAAATGDSSRGGSRFGGGRVCGCGLCEPVVSDDACSKDSDCAPDAPCHALRCVGLAHAHPRTAGTMCTEIMMCNSIDANACGCVKGKCTLHSR